MNWWAVSTPALLVVGMASCSALGQPAEGAATPATLSNVLKSASGGETIVLAPGDYGAMHFPQKVYSPAIRIQAQQASFTGLILTGVSGVTIDGGMIVGPGGRSYGVSIREARNIRVANMTISGAHRGIVVNQGEDIALVGNRLTGLISDGINVAYSRQIRIERNSCRDFRPTPAVYDAAGNRLKDGDHADCIQAWSRPAFPPTSDLTIIDNEADGLMQGIFLGNHIRNGIDDGGFDRVVIRGNRVRVGVPNGIAVSGLRQGEVTDNVVDTTPGATLPKPPHRPVRAKLMVLGTDVVQCGNRVAGMPNLPGQTPCQ